MNTRDTIRTWLQFASVMAAITLAAWLVEVTR